MHDDLVRREFTATALNELWLSDISEHWTREGKLYICAVKDVFSNRIVGYAIDSRMKSSLAVRALNNAVMRRGIVGLCVLQAVRAVSPRCHLTAVARHAHQAEAAKRLGADEIIRGEDVYAATARITGAKLYTGLFGNRTLLGGYDVVYDSIGSAATIQDSLRWARAGGAVVMVGFELSRQKVDLNPIWHQELDLTGIYAHGCESWQGGAMRTYDAVIDLLGRGALTVDGLVTHRFALGEWRKAIDTTLDKSTGAIKVMFDHSRG